LTYCIVEETKVRIDSLLEGIVSKTPPFLARTQYMGVFTGERPVIFIGVARNQRLASLHHLLWTELCESVDNRAAAYNEPSWIPHVTLVFGNDLNRGNIGPVMEKLAFRDFHHEFWIDNLTVLEDNPEKGIVIRNSFRLTGLQE